MCAGLTIYFGTFLYVTEVDTKCIAAKIFNHTQDGNWGDGFQRFGTVEEAIRSHEFGKYQYEFIQDVTKQFDNAISAIFC